jgi:hypothetical protein
MRISKSVYISGHIILNSIALIGLICGILHILNLYDGIYVIVLCSFICFLFIPPAYFLAKQEAKRFDFQSASIFIFISKLSLIGIWIISTVIVSSVIIYSFVFYLAGIGPGD